MRRPTGIAGAKQRLQKRKQPFQGGGCLPNRLVGMQAGSPELAVQGSFLSIPPTPVAQGVALHFGFDNVEHLSVELKLPGMFPA